MVNKVQNHPVSLLLLILDLFHHVTHTGMYGDSRELEGSMAMERFNTDRRRVLLMPHC